MTPAAAETAGGHAGPHWTYEGEGGPEHWGELSPEFKVCELGFEQTPINLRSAIRGQLSGVAPSFRPMPKEEAPETDTGQTITLDDLLPAGRSFFRYQGSLTTRPCSEGVLWSVFREPIEAAPAQIQQFASLFPNNARPIQGLNRRFLLESI